MSSDKSHNINWTDIFSVKNLFYTIIGALLAVIALKGFMIPNHFIDGGVIGISILLHEVFHLNISLQVVVFNIPFIPFHCKSHSMVCWIKVFWSYKVKSNIYKIIIPSFPSG